LRKSCTGTRARTRARVPRCARRRRRIAARRLASIRRGTLARFRFRADRFADLGPGSAQLGIEIRYPGIALPWYRGSRFSVRGLRPGGRDILSGDHGQRTPRKFHWLMDRQKKARIGPGSFSFLGYAAT